MNKYELAKKITQLEGLTNEEKASLVELLRSQKKYGLVWEDKPEEIETRLVDELPVLTEVQERAIVSDSSDAPNHILIEGDNLEALTALAYTHEGKIDVIYIDPPYNTRKKDFKYNDTFIDPEDSFSHSKWLSFISKRLKLAKTLLALNGVIFIQIDDREYAPLKLLCDELFQESNSLGPFIQNKLNAKNDTINIQKNHEYILCYRKRVQYIDEARTKILPNILIKNVRQKPVLKENGRFFYLNDSITTRGEGGTLNSRHNLGYTFYFNPETCHLVPIVDYDLEKACECNDEDSVYSTDKSLLSSGYVAIRPPRVRGKLGCWTWDINKATKDIDLLYVKKTRNRYNIHKRTFVPNDKVEELENGDYVYEEEFISNSKSILEYSTNDGTDTLVNVMGYETGFNNPKNVNLMEYLLSIIPNKKARILDFFAGSGTTLHATMQLNAEDGGHRKCILVTNNENNICEEVTYERNKRIIQGYTTPKGEAVEGLHANSLRYYRTTFLSRDKSVKNMRQLVRLATDMLCIKNDIYTEAPFCGKNINKNIARYFDNGQGNRMLVIYEERAIQLLVQLIAQTEDDGIKTMVYVFSPGADPYTDDFEDIAERVKLCALPSAIYEAYKRVLPKRKPKFLDEALQEMKTQAEAETNVQQTLDIGEDNDNMNEEGGEA